MGSSARPEPGPLPPSWWPLGSLWLSPQPSSGHSAQRPPSPIPEPLAHSPSIGNDGRCQGHTLVLELSREAPLEPVCRDAAFRTHMDTSWLALCRVHCRVTDLRSLLGIIKMHPGLRAILPAWLHHLLVSVCICFYFPQPFISLHQNILFVFCMVNSKCWWLLHSLNSVQTH